MSENNTTRKPYYFLGIHPRQKFTVFYWKGNHQNAALHSHGFSITSQSI